MTFLNIKLASVCLFTALSIGALAQAQSQGQAPPQAPSQETSVPTELQVSYINLEFKDKNVEETGFIRGWTANSQGARHADLVLYLDHREDKTPVFEQEVVLRLPVVVVLESSWGITFENAKFTTNKGAVHKMDGKKLSAILGKYNWSLKSGLGFKWGGQYIMAFNSDSVFVTMGFSMPSDNSWYKNLDLDLSWPMLTIYAENNKDKANWDIVVRDHSK